MLRSVTWSPRARSRPSTTRPRSSRPASRSKKPARPWRRSSYPRTRTGHPYRRSPPRASARCSGVEVVSVQIRYRLQNREGNFAWIVQLSGSSSHDRRIILPRGHTIHWSLSMRSLFAAMAELPPPAGLLPAQVEAREVAVQELVPGLRSRSHALRPLNAL